ncbi:hypothetical protein ESA94_03115 [Lacibacter luteus]|uniref:Uncharacterized protein n=1 Tax=Lacibacter luteus TaxID=2508719 RepID=A0A4Q1CMV1_9BACT|nr:hypothetical protein [Lacibacter luteus]RXK62021.1 hypothetical protein ESA94_03115 [Lacibacter luteus]
MQFDFTDQIKQKTDKELTDIYINSRNYNPEFVRLAKEELLARNIVLENFAVQKQEAEQSVKEELKEGKDGNPLYIFLCFMLALLGGLLGIYAGYVYSQSKIKTDGGETYYAYNKQTRQMGKLMMLVGVLAFLFIIFR